MRRALVGLALLLAAPVRAEEPALPEGLGAAPVQATAPPADDPDWRIRGFVEGRAGLWVDRDPRQQHAALSETRLAVETERRAQAVSLRLAADFLVDPLADGHGIDLDRGSGAIDLREAQAAFSPASFLDARIGRQILTWGTGDLLFVNDLFPKDWHAFLLGRDERYLKAPSDALKISAFSGAANLDLVYTPRFDADRFIDGRRLSYFDAAQGRRVGRDLPVREDRPNAWGGDDEWAARLYGNAGAVEGALYAYDGFWKSPAGVDPAGRATFPRLSVFGTSLRAPLAGGIWNAEIGAYRSRDDLDGTKPEVRNGELRALLGFEREIAKNTTLGLQYYLEHMQNHGAYLASLTAGAKAADENRHVLASRLTWLTMNQTLEWSLFAFFSPSDMDAYLRPRAKYKLDDHVTFELGGNLFAGASEHTFFGQFKDGDNVYLAARYGF